jgi:hypothetical protein
MKDYPNGSGQWTEHNGCRVEVYHDGSWAVYTLTGPFRSIASAERGKAADIEGAREAARSAYLELKK